MNPIRKQDSKKVVVTIVTAHKKFKSIEPEYLISNGIKIVISGKNCLDKDKYKKSGLIYHSIGR
jgi:UDP-N-acetyl-D-mannosaminuronate dehydrogenase